MNKGITKTITALGIGITSLCNLDCPHCYSRKLVQKSISFSKLKKIINNFSNLKKINFGTGESILHKNFKKIIEFLHERNFELALTSNGLSVNKLRVEDLKKFKDIDISLDFPKADLQDKWRGKVGIFNTAIRAIEKCKEVGITVSVVMCLMSHNYKYLPEFRKILDKYNIPLRINLYKPVYTKKYLLNYLEFWQAIELLAKNFKLVSNSEPILSLIVDDELYGSPCGNSARLHSDGKITPCVYLTGKFVDFQKFIEMKLQIPQECSNCPVAYNCRGGCLGRRLLTYGQPKPDQYCPILNNKKIPKIKFIRAVKENFIHSSYLCTIIVK
jgi:radical SAM protein with 4Fe4S-binding SPASM domain